MKNNRIKSLFKWLLVRPLAFLMLVRYRRFAVVTLAKTKDKKGYVSIKTISKNNLRGCFIYVVPVDPVGIEKVIKNLQKIRQDLVHKSKHHDGVHLKKIKPSRK